MSSLSPLKWHIRNLLRAPKKQKDISAIIIISVQNEDLDHIILKTWEERLYMTQQQYTVQSLELHLFFGRIMKEHAIFLEAGFTPANPDFSKAANQYKEQFETILHHAVHLGNGIIRPEVVTSGEVVTDYTLGSEQQTQAFTGIQIDQNITRLEQSLHGAANPQITAELANQVRELNANAGRALGSLIAWKKQILDDVLSCRMFTANYPLLLAHILHEAEEYQSGLEALAQGQNPETHTQETELFWDQIMLEHAVFIRGTLDPSENELIRTANGFAKEYNELLRTAKTATDTTIPSITERTLQETLRFRDFKDAGAKGIAACKIRSTILPLLADHVLREANRFIRLLRQFEGN